MLSFLSVAFTFVGQDISWGVFFVVGISFVATCHGVT